MGRRRVVIGLGALSGLAWFSRGSVSRRGSRLRPVVFILAQTERLPPKARSRVRKRMFKLVYDGVSRRAGRGEIGFLNYGYAPVGEAGAPLALSPETEADRYAIQLYDKVAGALPLRARDVLEVGCGRGGGAAFVFETHELGTMTGLDLSDVAIAQCRQAYACPGLQFVAGDAEALPFPDDSFDAIVNVESSHCYPNLGRFLSEVTRVLRPGGALLFADFRQTRTEDGGNADDLARLREQIAAAGLVVVEEEDITPNVVRAIELDSPRRRADIERTTPRFMRAQVLEFAGVEGSEIHRAFATGEVKYLRLVLRPANDQDQLPAA